MIRKIILFSRFVESLNAPFSLYVKREDEMREKLTSGRKKKKVQCARIQVRRRSSFVTRQCGNGAVSFALGRKLPSEMLFLFFFFPSSSFFTLSMLLLLLFLLMLLYRRRCSCFVVLMVLCCLIVTIDCYCHCCFSLYINFADINAECVVFVVLALVFVFALWKLAQRAWEMLMCCFVVIAAGCLCCSCCCYCYFCLCAVPVVVVVGGLSSTLSLFCCVAGIVVVVFVINVGRPSCCRYTHYDYNYNYRVYCRCFCYCYC